MYGIAPSPWRRHATSWEDSEGPFEEKQTNVTVRPHSLHRFSKYKPFSISNGYAGQFYVYLFHPVAQEVLSCLTNVGVEAEEPKLEGQR